MSKRAVWICGIITVCICSVICILAIHSCSAFSLSEPITELNQTYEGSVLKITATDIKAVQSDYSGREEIVIGVQFSVENVSNEDVIVTDDSIQAYFDDVIANWTMEHFLSDTFLGGTTIPPGKRAVRSCYFKVPENAYIIELRFPEGYDSKQYATFILDVPPVDESIRY